MHVLFSKKNKDTVFFMSRGFVAAVSDLVSDAIPVPSSRSKGWVGFLEGGGGDEDHEPRVPASLVRS